MPITAYTVISKKDPDKFAESVVSSLNEGKQPFGPPFANPSNDCFVQIMVEGSQVLVGSDGAAGPTGPEGPQGPQGPKGDNGAALVADSNTHLASGAQSFPVNTDGFLYIWLSDNSTVITPTGTPIIGYTYVVRLLQTNSGGHTVDWSNFGQIITPSGVDMVPDATNNKSTWYILYPLSSGVWVLVNKYVS